MPTLITSYNLTGSGTNSNVLTTPSFTPANGEVIVVKVSTWDSATTMSAPTGGSQTFTKQAGSTVGGFRPYVAVYTATVSGSPGAMTISSTPSASSWHNMVVERWSGATLAATPISNAAQTVGGGAAISSTVAGLTAGSIWSWVASDTGSVDPATRAYLDSPTEEFIDDGHVGSNAVFYYARQTATGGSNSYGLTAPAGMSAWIAGVEVLASGGPPPPTNNGQGFMALFA